MQPREEPCSINADDVAEFLEEQCSPRRAEFVRWLGTMCRDANLREQRLRDDLTAAVERLWQYEGKPDRSRNDPRPDD